MSPNNIAPVANNICVPIARALTLRAKIQGRRNVRACAIGTHMLFGVLITFYWCEIIGAYQLALFRNLRARSELIIGNTHLVYTNWLVRSLLI